MHYKTPRGCTKTTCVVGSLLGCCGGDDKTKTYFIAAVKRMPFSWSAVATEKLRRACASRWREGTPP